MRSFLVPSGVMLLGCTGIFAEQDKSDDTADGDCEMSTWYNDQDGDGFGDPARDEDACEAPNKAVRDDSDCDDQDPNVFPGAVEVCDEFDADEDCDGDSDEEDDDVELDTFYADEDGDGFGNPDAPRQACDLPSEHVEDNTDCDDGDNDINPDGREVCDTGGDDEDCDGDVNDDDDSMSTSGLPKFYEDNDHDGYGDGSAVSACELGNGYADRTGDCDDNEDRANPGESEECNDGIDNDCDGSDDGCGFSGTFTASSGDAIIEGAAAGDAAGIVFGVGDQNGDGDDDFMVAASGAGSSGAGHLFYGGVSGRVDTSSDDVTITGSSSEGLGWGGTGGYDWNDDGDPDLAISAPYRTYNGATNGGVMYVFFGPNTADVTTGSSDRAVSGNTYDYVSFYIYGTDWDGDGVDDLAYEVNNSIYIDRGPVVSGSASPSADVTLTQSGTFTDLDFADVNGDGADDVLIGGGWQSSYTGTTWYAEGGIKSGSLNVSGNSESYFTGLSYDDYAGGSVALCDLDDDGKADAVIGASGATGNAASSGEVYIFEANFTAGGQSVSTADAILRGTTASDQFGMTVECVGDVNADGNDDMAVLAPYADSGGTSSGTTYLFFGPVSGTVEAAAADAIIKGDGATDLPFSIAGIGDHNGDGAPDVAIGSKYNDDGGTDAGSVWVFEGGGI